jgi:hypothetical protein
LNSSYIAKAIWLGDEMVEHTHRNIDNHTVISMSSHNVYIPVYLLPGWVTPDKQLPNLGDGLFG